MVNNRKAILSEERDIPLLNFLWRWKMSTTSAIAQRFYSHSSVNGAYMRLWKLKRAGFIRLRTDVTGNFFVWTLDKKGYEAIRSRLPVLREDGYLSENLRHDLIVSGIHLGDGIFGHIQEIELWSEQELRRIDLSFFPSWVPRSKRHRPDGYWRLVDSTGQKLIALEVELSLKPDTTYELTARFYDDHTEINEIIWVVPRPNMAQKIHALMEKASRRGYKHSFVLLDSVISLGWQAPVIHGHRFNSSIADILETEPKRTRKALFGQFSFDTRKSPHKSKHCRLIGAPSFLY